MEDAWLTRKTLLMRAVEKNDEYAWDDFVNYYRDFIFMVLIYNNLIKKYIPVLINNFNSFKSNKQNLLRVCLRKY